MEKGLLRSLSPVKNDESNEAMDFLNSFLSTSEEKPMRSEERRVGKECLE